MGGGGRERAPAWARPADAPPASPPSLTFTLPRFVPPSPPPCSLLFERDLTPHPQYAAFYKWVQQGFQAHAVLHFGMHGTVEWLPGAPLGNSGLSWSDVLLGGWWVGGWVGGWVKRKGAWGASCPTPPAARLQQLA